MAKITNIKTRDGAVHPIALPFAVCSSTAGATIKTLTFSGGDTPTELVNGQQIMVQFTNGNTTACSISIPGLTSTPAMTLNNTNVAPYIGAGAVVNLTYNGSKFYVSNAAALTGFKVPTDVTLATVTNDGQLTKLINNATIGITLTSDPDFSRGIENNSKIYNIVNKATIYNISNNSNKTIETITNGGTITKINNTNGNIRQLANAGQIIKITNVDQATIEEINNGTITGEGGFIGGISNGKVIGWYQDEQGNRSTVPQDGYFPWAGISNRGTIVNIQSEGLISLIGNSGTVSSLTNSGTITTESNSGTISAITNTGTIEKINNTTGTIGVSGSGFTTNGIFNDSSATIYYVENGGKVVTFKNTGTTGNSGDTATGVQNTGNLYNITNGSGGTVYKLTNMADVKTITNSGNISSITNSGTIGEISLTSSGSITKIVNAGSIGTSENNNTGIFNDNYIYNIQNNGQIDRIIQQTYNSNTYVIANIDNIGNSKITTINSYGYGGKTAKIDTINNGSDDSADCIIDKICNRGTINTITTAGTIGSMTVQSGGVISTLAVNNGGTIENVTSHGSILGLINGKNGVMGTAGDTTTQNAIINHGTITRIKNDSGTDGNGDIQVLYNDSSALIDYIDNRGKIKEIQNPGTLGNVGSPTFSGGLTNSGHLYRISNSSAGTIYTISNSGTIEQFNNNSNINTFTVGSTGSIGVSTDSTKKLENNGQIYRIDNNNFIGKITSPGVYSTYYGLFNSNNSTIGYISNEGYIPFITNKASGDIYQESNAGSITTLTNSGTITYCTNTNYIYSLSNAGRIGNYTSGGTGISNTGTINNIQNSRDILLIGNDTIGTIGSINNAGTIDLLVNSGNFKTLTNNNRLNKINNSGTITGLTNEGTITSITNSGTIITLNSSSKITNLTVSNKTIISGGAWQIAPQLLMENKQTWTPAGTTGSYPEPGTLERWPVTSSVTPTYNTGGHIISETYTERPMAYQSLDIDVAVTAGSSGTITNVITVTTSAGAANYKGYGRSSLPQYRPTDMLYRSTLNMQLGAGTDNYEVFLLKNNKNEAVRCFISPVIATCRHEATTLMGIPLYHYSSDISDNYFTIDLAANETKVVCIYRESNTEMTGTSEKLYWISNLHLYTVSLTSSKSSLADILGSTNAATYTFTKNYY